uniref:F-box domain-containing protein n=1 Tax=Plectus sambesii TaxID=2011161 RepID=A0A914XJ73_9BILA
MSVAALKAKVARLKAENERLRRALPDFSERIVCGQPTGKLPDNSPKQFSQLPDRSLQHVLRFLPARQVVQMRHISRKFNNLIVKCSKTMPKKENSSSVSFKSFHAGEVEVELRGYNSKPTVVKLAGDNVALSELLRFICISGSIYFGEGVSAADEVLDQLSKSWLTIRPEMVIFAGDLSQTSRHSLKAFLKKVEPSIKHLLFQNASNIGRNLLSDDLIGVAGRLDGLLVMPACWGAELRNINISDKTLLAMVETDQTPSHFCLMGCSGITPGGILAFAMEWIRKKRSKADEEYYDREFGMELCQLAFYNCTNVTVAAIEKECGFLLGKAAVYQGAGVSSMRGREKTNDQRVCFNVHPSSTNRYLQVILHYAPFHAHMVRDLRTDFDDVLNGFLADADDAEGDAATPPAAAASLTAHATPAQPPSPSYKRRVEAILKEYKEVFQSELGYFTKKAIHELQQDSQLVRLKVTQVPFAKKQRAKEELDRLVVIDVITPP